VIVKITPGSYITGNKERKLGASQQEYDVKWTSLQRCLEVFGRIRCYFDVH